MRGTPRALRKLTHCLCYARDIKTYTLQGTAVVCFSQRWVNTNFGIIYNTLHVCVHTAMATILRLQKNTSKIQISKATILQIGNRSIEH